MRRATFLQTAFLAPLLKLFGKAGIVADPTPPHPESAVGLVGHLVTGDTGTYETLWMDAQGNGYSMTTYADGTKGPTVRIIGA